MDEAKGLRIRTGGFLTTVQDGGRFGYRRCGVPHSGPMDRRSFHTANLLVGNDRDEAALEITLLGPEVECTADCRIAVTGGDFAPTCNGSPLPMYQAVEVKRGDILGFAGARTGCRCYLALSGGLDVPVVLGSRSTLLHAGLGGLEGRRLEAGDEVGRKDRTTHQCPMIKSIQAESFQQRNVTLRVVMGQPSGDESSQALLTQEYKVTSRFDRQAYRLEGEAAQPATLTGDGGVTMGAIWIGENGHPVVAMADCQDAGEHPVMAVVASVDLPLLAQRKSGDRVRFQPVTVEEAQALYLEELELLDVLEQGGNPGAAAVTGGGHSKYLIAVHQDRFHLSIR